jgi:hypothetical protein
MSNVVDRDAEDIDPAVTFEVGGAISFGEIVAAVGSNGKGGVRWKGAQGEVSTAVDVAIVAAKVASGNGAEVVGPGGAVGSVIGGVDDVFEMAVEESSVLRDIEKFPDVVSGREN